MQVTAHPVRTPTRGFGLQTHHNTAVFRLVEDGRLSLESPISDHLPFSIDDRWVDVTILDLLQQHSGLPANRSSWFGGQWDT